MVTSAGVSVLLSPAASRGAAMRVLLSVLRSDYDGEIEVLVAEPCHNGEAPCPAGLLTSEPRIRVVTMALHTSPWSTWLGLAEQAGYTSLLLLDPRVIVTPGCIRRLITRLRADDGVGTVTAQLRRVDGTPLALDLSGRPDGFPGSLPRSEGPVPAANRSVCQVPSASAVCLAVHRDELAGERANNTTYSSPIYGAIDLCFTLARAERAAAVERASIAYYLDENDCQSVPCGDPTPQPQGSPDQSRQEQRLRTDRDRFQRRWPQQLATMWDGSMALLSQRRAQPAARTSGKEILWILPEMLRPDRAGGDARVWKELQALVQAGDHVTVWMEELCEEKIYGPPLQELGIRWFGTQAPRRWPLDTPRTEVTSLETLLERFRFDVAVIWSPAFAARVAPVLRELCPHLPIVIDNGVLWFLQYERAARLGVQAPGFPDVRSWELAVYGQADGVIVSSHDEADIVGPELPEVPLFTFDVGAQQPVVPSTDRSSGSLVFIGNFYHPPNLDAVEWWLSEIVPAMQQRCRRSVPLRLVGTGSQVHVESWAARGEIEATGWVEDLATELTMARACVVPLRYGAGTKDKIAIAFQHGVPIVTTSIGAESMPPAMVEAMVVADDATRLAMAIDELMTDDQVWQQRSEQTLQAAWQVWEQHQQDAAKLTVWLREICSR